jgi:magnesium transporter
MIHTLYRTHEGLCRLDLVPQEFGSALRDGRGLLWVDFEGVEPGDERILDDVFKFHPLAIEDALSTQHIPKLDDWGAYLYLVLHAVSYDREAGEVNTLELDVFLGKNFIVTHHDEPIAALARVWATCQRDERYLANGPDHLLYALADAVVADYLPVVEEMDDRLDEIENQVFARPSPRVLEELFALKRSLVRLRRIVGPQREVLNKLARDQFSMIDLKDRVYFRDVYDHLVRLYDIIDSTRDLAGGALDTYLSVVNNKMNDIMKTLTVITTLFMPLSFVVGFFGMNFFQPATPLDIWTGEPAFAATLIGMLLVPVGMFVWMRRRGWM